MTGESHATYQGRGARKNAAGGKSEAIYFDDDLPGFGLRLRERGSRTFVFQYKLGAKQRRVALGAATALNLATVRKEAGKLYARVKLGEDPASDKAEAQAKAVHTFKAAAEKYLEHQRARLRERSYPDLERHLLKHAKTLHELQLGKIARADIAAVINSVTKNSGQVTANRVRTSLSSFFSWAMEQGLVETNPVIGTSRQQRAIARARPGTQRTALDLERFRRRRLRRHRQTAGADRAAGRGDGRSALVRNQ